MDEFKELMHFSRGERMAIIFVSAAIAVAVLLLFVPATRPQPNRFEMTDIDSLNRLQLQTAETGRTKITDYEIVKADVPVATSKLKPFRFNPNGLPAEKWKEMGLSDKQIRSIKNYEMKGGRFVCKEDFRKMYLISDEEYKVLEPYIEIPVEKYRRVEDDKPKEKPHKAEVEPKKDIMVNLNTADSSELVQLPGVAPWTAHRIVDYRNKLGGFVSKLQLTEVRGIDSLKFANIESMVFIGDEKPVAININDDSFSDMLKHPYFDYKTVKSIVNYRQKRGVITDYNQLLGILDGLPNPLIEKYINYE